MQSENDSLVREERDAGHHFTEEILAQTMCQAHATQRNLYGIVYAVGRRCDRQYTCSSICASPYIHVQDSQTAHLSWSCISAYHVYNDRPATSKSGDRQNARLGLKSKGEKCDYAGCGPNYCCCYAA